MRFERAAILWRLGLLLPEALAEAALRELQDGPYSFALVELGTEHDLGFQTIAKLIETAAREIGVALPTQIQAIHLLACEIAHEIVSGQADPLSGAERLAKLYFAGLDTDDPVEALAFFSGCDEHVIASGIVEEAGALLAKWKTRP